MLTMVENNEVTASLRRFWELQSIGITETANPTMSQKEELAVNVESYGQPSWCVGIQ